MAKSRVGALVLLGLLLSVVVGQHHDSAVDRVLRDDAAGVLQLCGDPSQEIRIYTEYTNTVNNGYYVNRDGLWRYVKNGKDLGPVDGSFLNPTVNIPFRDAAGVLSDR